MQDVVAIIGCLYPDRSGTGDFVTYAADVAGDNGATGLKFEFSESHTTKYPDQDWDGAPTTLTELAQETCFETVFSDARFSRFVINTITFANGVNNDWVNEWPPAADAAEYTEVYNFACHLLSTYSGKAFVIQNWEGDWSLIGSYTASDPVPVDRLARLGSYLRTRQRAIRDARRDTTSSSTIVHAVEVNRCLDLYGDRVHQLLHMVRPDAVSFSLYECINTYGANTAATEAIIESRMMRAVFNIRRVLGNNVGLCVGEFGQPELEAGFISLGLDVGALTLKVRSVATTLGFLHCAFWQLFDNEEQSPGVYRGFCVFDDTLTLTDQGTALVAVW